MSGYHPRNNLRVSLGFLFFGKMLRIELVRVAPVLRQEMKMMSVEGDGLSLPDQQTGVGKVVVLLRCPQIDTNGRVEPQALEDHHVKVRKTLDDDYDADDDDDDKNGDDDDDDDWLVRPKIK